MCTVRSIFSAAPAGANSDDRTRGHSRFTPGRRIIVLIVMPAAAIAGCSSSPLGPTPGRQVTQPARAAWSLSPERVQTRSPESGPGSFDYITVASMIAKQGYSIFAGPAREGSPGPLRAFSVLCAGTATGHCGTVDLFYNNRYVGGLQSAQLGSLFIRVFNSKIVSQNGHQISIDFPLSKPADALCCATGGTFLATYTWNGKSVIATGPQANRAPRIVAKPSN